MNMADVPSERPTEATLYLWDHVEQSVQLTFGETFRQLSCLQGRSVEDYCTQENVPGYLIKYFTLEERNEIALNEPNKWDRKLLYKSLKYLCGLADRNDCAWDPGQDTLESHISYIFSEMGKLQEAAGFTDHSVKCRLYKIRSCLEKILDKVERKKQVDLGNIRQEIMKEPQSTSSDSALTASCSCNVPYTYRILKHHVIHRIFVMTYQQLNCLEGRSLRDYVTKTKQHKNLRFLTTEEYRLVNKVEAQNWPIRLLFKLHQRVCDIPDYKNWASSEDKLGYYLHIIKQDHESPALLDKKTCADRSYQLYTHLHRLLSLVAEKTGKSKKDILKEMPDEPMCLDKSFQELPQVDSPLDQKMQLNVAAPPLAEQGTHQSLTSSSTQGEVAAAAATFAQQQSLPALLPSKTTVTYSITPEEIYVSCWFKALRSGGPAVKAIAKAIVALNGSIDNVSKKKKKLFTDKEISELQGSFNKQELTSLYMEQDITMLYKLARFGCNLADPSNDIWISKGDSLEYYFFSVKELRNDLAHSIREITKDKLRLKIENLEDLLEKILNEAGSRSNENLQQEVNEMKKELQELKDPPPILTDKESYENSVKKLREDLAIKVVDDADEELHERYQDATSNNASPVTWSYNDKHKNITIDKVFSDLEFTDTSNLGCKSTYSLEDMLLLQAKNAMGSRIIIVEGGAGTGKTSMCQYLTYIWSGKNRPESLQSVDILIYIRCRYISKDHASLASYLRVHLPKTFENKNLEDIIPLIQVSRVMFLVDGYDEAGRWAKQLLDNILVSLPEARMIITSKPQWVPKLRSSISKHVSPCLVLKVVGFRREAQDKYIQKFFGVMQSPHQMSSCDEFLNYLRELEKQLENLTQTPLTLALLAVLWIQDLANAKKAKTVTHLYQKLTDFRLKWLYSQECNLSEEEEEDVHDEGEGDEARKVAYQQWMFALGKMAWDNLQNNRHYVNENDVRMLKKKVEKLVVDVERAMSCLLRCETQTDLTDTVNIWTFTHNCQQEYLAAEFIVEEITTKDRLLSDVLGFKGKTGEEKKLQRLMPVIEFVTDLLSFKDAMTDKRALEIAKLVLVQAPWSFAAVKRMAPSLLRDSEELQEEFKMMRQEEMIGDTLEGYDPLCVEWVLQKTSYGVPSCIRLTNLVSDVFRMEPLLQLLAQRSCQAEVIICMDQVESLSELISFIQKNENSRVHFTFQTWNIHALREIVSKWPWTRPLHFSFVSEIFPLLWWELMICLVEDTVPALASVTYSNPDCRDSTLVKEGAQILSVDAIPDSGIQDNEVTYIHLFPRT